MQGRNPDIWVAVFEVQALPIVIVAWVREPIEEIGGEGLRSGADGARWGTVIERVVRERKRVFAVNRVGDFLHLAIQSILREARGPGFVEPLFERAALIGPAIVIVAGGHDRTDACKMGGMPGGGEHLRC